VNHQQDLNLTQTLVYHQPTGNHQLIKDLTKHHRITGAHHHLRATGVHHLKDNLVHHHKVNGKSQLTGIHHQRVS